MLSSQPIHLDESRVPEVRGYLDQSRVPEVRGYLDESRVPEVRGYLDESRVPEVRGLAYVCVYIYSLVLLLLFFTTPSCGHDPYVNLFQHDDWREHSQSCATAKMSMLCCWRHNSTTPTKADLYVYCDCMCI